MENALGNTDAALQNLNVVAKRAYGVDNYYTARTQDAIDNAIISEILKEFVAESKHGGHTFALIRNSSLLRP